MHLKTLCALAALATAGCAPASWPSSPSPSLSPAAGAPASAPAASVPVPGTCNAAPAQYALGRTADVRLVEETRQRSGSDMARVLRPGQMVTKEFNAQRLNLEADASGKVVRIACG